MAQNRLMTFGPAYIANAAADILNSKVTSVAGPTGFTLPQPYLLLKQIRVVNSQNVAAPKPLEPSGQLKKSAGTKAPKEGGNATETKKRKSVLKRLIGGA